MRRTRAGTVCHFGGNSAARRFLLANRPERRNSLQTFTRKMTIVLTVLFGSIAFVVIGVAAASWVEGSGKY
jgi:hypothetical protein